MDNCRPSEATPLISVRRNLTIQPADTPQQSHTQRPRTTPDWNPQNALLIYETFEDRNDDSGVSPGHYETSPSPEGRSSDNGGFSPCSSTSQDSANLPSCSFHVAQANYQRADTPMDYAVTQSTQVTPRSRSNVVRNQLNEVSSTVKPKRARATRAHRINFECPLCGVQEMNRELLWEHLRIHYNPNRLPDEPAVPQTLNIPGSSPEDVKRRIAKYDRNSSYPIINAQGKVKLISCKICEFHAITKVEFWRHTKHHLKVEKRLYCQYCPFVTDLKHHYEYHLNKETGAKPFACKKCSYKCVNKSMLSSHMKSHTDIRQFSCADCSYLTKYCHSLKMHLRKYGHAPASVLNPDGTVNKYTTIDVYGTRRGPKASTILAAQSGNRNVSTQPRKKRNQKKSKQTKSVNVVALPQNSPPNEPQQLMVNPMAMMNPFAGAGFNSMLAMQYNHMLRNRFSVVEPYTNNNVTATRNVNQYRANIFAEFMMVAERMQHAGAASNIPQNIHLHYNAHPHTDAPQPVVNSSGQHTPEPANATQDPQEVLDLSVPSSPTTASATNNNNSSVNIVSNVQTSNTTANQNSEQSQPSTPNSQKASGTSRRKGRAVKLNRRSVGHESDEGNQSEGTRTPGRGTPESSSSGGDANDISLNASEANNSVLLKCNFCPISFGNEAMYTIHMGYHGFQDPYTCNICGHKCEDALSFNVHLSRASHA